MPKWWFCGNEDCQQFEKSASADKQPDCPYCREPMTFIEENDLTHPSMPRMSVPERPDRTLERVYSEYYSKPDLEEG